MTDSGATLSINDDPDRFQFLDQMPSVVTLAPEGMPFTWWQDASIQLKPQGTDATEWIEVSITLAAGTLRLRVEYVVDDDSGSLVGRFLVHVVTTPDGATSTALIRPPGTT